MIFWEFVIRDLVNVGSPEQFIISLITSHVNISWREQVVWPTKGTGALQHHKFLIFDGKQHPKKIWFRGR